MRQTRGGSCPRGHQWDSNGVWPNRSAGLLSIVLTSSNKNFVSIGSGKTFTMLGSEDDKPGIIPFAIDDVFEHIQARVIPHYC
jgi:hypothetical protein